MKNELTYQCARDAASKTIVGVFGIDDVLTIAEIFYYALEVWKACSPTGPDPDQSYKAVICAAAEGDGQRYSSHMLHRAGRAVKRAARRHGYDLSDNDRDLMTTHLLNYVATMPNKTLRHCCCHESPTEPLKYMGMSDEGI